MKCIQLYNTEQNQTVVIGSRNSRRHLKRLGVGGGGGGGGGARREKETNGLTDTNTQREVSNLVFHAQSTSAVILGWRQRLRQNINGVEEKRHWNRQLKIRTKWAHTHTWRVRRRKKCKKEEEKNEKKHCIKNKEGKGVPDFGAVSCRRRLVSRMNVMLMMTVTTRTTTRPACKFNPHLQIHFFQQTSKSKTGCDWYNGRVNICPFHSLTSKLVLSISGMKCWELMQRTKKSSYWILMAKTSTTTKFWNKNDC